MAGRLLLVPGLFRDDRIFLEEFARGGEEDWALFATRSLLERWHTELLRRAAGGAVGGRRLLLFGGLGRLLLGRTAPRPVSEAARQTIMARLLARLVREGRLRVLGPLAGSPHLAKEVALVHGEFRRGLVPRESLLALAEEDPLQADLALCFAEYERTLAEAGWCEEEDLLALALRAIEEGRRPPVRSLLVHGFTDFTPLQAAVLRALARSAAVTVLLPEFGGYPALADLRRGLRGQFPDWELSHSPPTIEGRTGLERLALGGRGIGPGDESVQELVGEGPAALASLIARVARARLRADPSLLPGEIAVVRREGLPSDGLPEALRRHGLPVEEEEGPPLLSLNGVGAILAALDCLARDWPRTSVLRLARGVFVGEEAHLVEILARASAEAKVVRTKAAWMRLSSSDASAEDPVGTALSRLERGLALLPEEGTTTDYLGALRAFAAFWQLPARYWPRHQDERALAAYTREMRGLERLFGLLEEMAAAEEAAGEARTWDVSSFAAELLRLAGENHCPEASGLGGGVRCLGPSEIRGLRFRLVFLVGLVEGEFPKPIAEDWLLPDEKRLRLRGAFHGLELRRTLAAREWQLLANVVSAARETLYLCRSEVDARGEETVPSVFLSFLRERLGAIPVRRLGAGELLPADPGEAWDESTMKARLVVDLLWHELPPEREEAVLAAYEERRAEVAALLARTGPPRPLDGSGVDTGVAADLRARFGPERVMATSALEDYATCPFLFFARRLLRLEEEEVVEEDLSGLELGQAYHTALERFFRRCGEAPLTREGIPLYERVMAETVAQAFAPLSAKARTEAARRLWAIAEEACLAALLRLVRAEMRANERFGPRRTLHCELGFGLEERFGLDPSSRRDPLVLGGGELRLSGKIDRVDLLPGGYYAVYDYKLGRVPEPSAVLEGRALQIPLYLLAARELFFPDREPAGAGYYGLRDLSRRSGLWRAEIAAATGIGTRTKGSLGEEEWKKALSAIEERALAAARGIRAGDFRPLPPEEDCPPYCPFGRVCRKEAGRP